MPSGRTAGSSLQSFLLPALSNPAKLRCPGLIYGWASVWKLQKLLESNNQ